MSRPLSVRDLADPAQGPHAIQVVLDRVVRALSERWPCRLVLRRSMRMGLTRHQAEIWSLRTGAPVGLRDLGHMIGVATQAGAPGFTVSAIAAATVAHATDGRRVDVRLRGAWIEIGRGGVVDALHLSEIGAPTGASGLVLTLDLDQLVMLAKGIDDPTLLQSQDPAVAGQMLDLEPYVPPHLIERGSTRVTDLEPAWPRARGRALSRTRPESLRSAPR